MIYYCNTIFLIFFYKWRHTWKQIMFPSQLMPLITWYALLQASPSPTALCITSHSRAPKVVIVAVVASYSSTRLSEYATRTVVCSSDVSEFIPFLFWEFDLSLVGVVCEKLLDACVSVVCCWAWNRIAVMAVPWFGSTKDLFCWQRNPYFIHDKI